MVLPSLLGTQIISEEDVHMNFLLSKSLDPGRQSQVSWAVQPCAARDLRCALIIHT